MQPLHNDLSLFANAIIHGDETLPEMQREYLHYPLATALAVYRNNYRGNLHDALTGAYPVVAQLVGDEFFRFMTRTFIAQYPSRSGNLHHYGAEMASFIANFAPAQALAYLPDVASLEWACHCTYFAADVEALNLQSLAQTPLESYSSLIAQINPAARVIHSQHPIAAIWRAHQQNFESDFHINLDSGPTITLVYRRNGIVQIDDLPKADAVWLRALQTGATLGNAVAATLEHYPGFDLQSALLNLVSKEVITDLKLEAVQ